MSVFIDTSGFYAFVCAEDAQHASVVAVIERLARERERLVSNSYVVCETMGLIQRRLGLSLLRAFVDGTMPLLDIWWIGINEHSAAWQLMQAKPRRGLTIVDATGMVIMRQAGIRRCVTLDPEFTREGFEVLPE